MPKVTGVARGATKGYAVWNERSGQWLSTRTDEHHRHAIARWVDTREGATWFKSIDNALRAVRECGIDMGAIHVLPMRSR